MRFSVSALVLHLCSKTTVGLSPTASYSSITTSWYHQQHTQQKLRLIRSQAFRMKKKSMFSSTSTFSMTATDPGSNVHTEENTKEKEEIYSSPWSEEAKKLNAKQKSRKGQNDARFRQHVNPLSRKFQIPTELPPNWPADGSTFNNPSLPLFLDIGCGKGGFLLDLATKRLEEEEGELKMNYLGLEIRPSVVEYAQERLPKWNLSGKVSFVGCNANVDLERILSLYCSEDNNNAPLEYVSIQYPDPHFKNRHEKRRVVTPELVTTLAKYIPVGKIVFLQSDIKNVLDIMRERFREQSIYFEDELENVDEYLEENPLGVPTEREVSVLKKDLPVYRTIFRRTSAPVINGDDGNEGEE